MMGKRAFRLYQVVATATIIAGFLTIRPLEISAQGFSELPSVSDYETVKDKGRELLQIPLRDILYWALQESGSVQSAAIDIESARSSLIAAEDSKKLSLSNRLTVGRSLNLYSSNLNGTSSGSYLSYISANTVAKSSKLSKKDSNGIIYSMQYSLQSFLKKLQTINSKGDNSNESSIDDQLESAALTFGVSIPILKGWGEVNQLEENKNRVQLKIAKKMAEQTRQSLLQLLAGTYWNLVGLWESKGIAEKAVELSQKLFAENQERARLGILKLIEVKQTAIQLNRNKLTVMKMEKSIREVEDQLKILLGIEDIPYGFIPKDKPQFKKIEDNVETLEAKMLENSSALGLIDDNLEINRLTTAKALNDNQPDLDFTLNYTFNGAGDNFLSSSQGWSDQKLNTYTLGVTWNIPLFDKKNSEALNRKRLKQSQLDIKRRDTRLQLRSELYTQLRNLEFIKQNIVINEAQHGLAEQILNEEIEKMKLGQSRTYLVSEAQQDQIKAKLGVISARIEYEKAYFSILLLTGDVYQVYGLQPQVIQGDRNESNK